MDKNVRDFLINMVSQSFSDIGYALRILLGDGVVAESEAIISRAENAGGRVKALKAIADKTAEEKSVNTPSNEPGDKREDKAIDETAEPIRSEEPLPGAEAPSALPAEEKAKHKTTIVDVRKIMTELSRKGKGKVIQDVLSKDFSVTKLSDVKEDDYDDFITRVLYYAGETDEFVEVDNA